MRALFEIVVQEFTLPHHVRVPDWKEELGRFQRTGFVVAGEPFAPT